MNTPEFSRMIDVRQADGRTVELKASEPECAALAQRFAILRIDRLEAQITLEPESGEIAARGRLAADIVQSCAVSAEDLPVSIDEALAFRFVPARSDHRPDEEVELAAEDLDEIEFSGTTFDLGEAVAQSLALAIDPFAVGPHAEQARQGPGLADGGASGPFSALAALKKDAR